MIIKTAQKWAVFHFNQHLTVKKCARVINFIKKFISLQKRKKEQQKRTRDVAYI